MGGVLGRPPASPRSPPGHCDTPEGPGARSPPLYRVGRVQQVLRAQQVLCAHAAPRPRPGPGPAPGPSSRAAAASEAKLRLRLCQGRDSAARALPSAGFLRRTIWFLRHPRTVPSPVTVRICPPERSGPAPQPSAPVILCAGPSEPKLLAQHVPDDSDRNGARTAARPSAFTPLAKRGALAFVPRPGPLPGPLGAGGPRSTPKPPRRQEERDLQLLQLHPALPGARQERPPQVFTRDPTVAAEKERNRPSAPV
ncbi:POM121-like protein 2 [Heterocephalus glaber]|uniref:POM121-like protein 2 n=1 Tax=Heterocephalus glaber TaxID=10181 RepID=A0AAX6T4L8_HETGA|nr:POM121-like protein 2 [Heterocephalus glaber]